MRRIAIIALSVFVSPHAMADPSRPGQSLDREGIDLARAARSHQDNGGELRRLEISGIGSDAFRVPLAAYDRNAPGVAGDQSAWFHSFCIAPGELDAEAARLLPMQFAPGAPLAYDGAGGNPPATSGALQRLIGSVGGEVGAFAVGQSGRGGAPTAVQAAIINTWDNAYNFSAPGGWSEVGNVRVLQVYESADALMPPRRPPGVPVASVPNAVVLGAIGLGVALWLKRRYT